MENSSGKGITLIILCRQSDSGVPSYGRLWQRWRMDIVDLIKENEEAVTYLIEETSGRALANNHLRKESIREVLEYVGKPCEEGLQVNKYM